MVFQPDLARHVSPTFLSLKSIIFVALVSLMLLAMVLGGFGLYQIRAHNDQFNKIQRESVPKTEMAREMRNAGYARMFHILRMTAHTDMFERDAEYLRFNEHATRFIRARETLRKLPMTVAEQRRLSEMLEHTRIISQTQDLVADLLLSGRDADAKSILLTQVIPLQDTVIRELAEFVQLNNQAVAHEHLRANQRYRQSVYVMVGVAMLALVLGSLVIWRVTRQVDTQEAQVQDEIHQAEAAAEHDVLTGLFNRRGFEPRIQAQMKNWQIGKRHTFLMMDLDGFKAVNDTGGHAAGDALLQGLAKQFVSLVRGRDLIGRLGGDEFAIVLLDTPGSAGLQVAETIRASVQEHVLNWEGKTYRVGVSIGVVEIDNPFLDVEQLMKQADAACYAAKQQGRNQVCLAA